MPKKLSKHPLGSTSTVNTASTSSSGANGAAPSFLTDDLPVPRLIVFDLDYTLWPFWVDTHVSAPLKANPSHTSASDKFGETFQFYPEVPRTLYTLSNAGIKLGVASRTNAPELARDLLKMLHVQPPGPGEEGEGAPAAAGSSKKKEKPKKALEYFDAGMEIFPGSKIRHFEGLYRKTGIAFTDMLFFDDESRNRDTESMGVTMWLVRDGVSWDEIEKGVAEWRKRRGYR